MNKYIKNLTKIEFAVTDACTGKCTHCSEGNHKPFGEKIDPAIAANVVNEITKVYNIQTVMAFGGNLFFTVMQFLKSWKKQEMHMYRSVK